MAADDDESSVDAEKYKAVIDGVLDQRDEAFPIALFVGLIGRHHPLATTTKHERSTAMAIEIVFPKRLIFIEVCMYVFPV
jgi:hypothetical protein